MSKASKDWGLDRYFSRDSDRKNDHRSEYQKDLTAIIHSYSFRRLQGKFQMISGKECDFTRNRLTHSLEVSTIAKNIFYRLRALEYPAVLYDANDIMAEKIEIKTFINNEPTNGTAEVLSAISLLHDIGNPPFGHAGEVALNYMMLESGGFEGNAQALHLLTKPEFFSEKFNLTKRVLLGVLKYNSMYSEQIQAVKDLDMKNRMIDYEKFKPPKCHYDEDHETVNWLLQKLSESDRKKFNKTFDCSVMELADDITNRIHDFEDMAYMKLARYEDISNYISGKKKSDKFDCKHYEDICADFEIITGVDLCQTLKNLFEDNSSKLKKSIGTLVHYAVCSTQLHKNKDMCIDSQYKKDDSLEIFKYRVELSKRCRMLLNLFEDMEMDLVIKKRQAQTFVQGGMLVLMQLFEVYSGNPERFLPQNLYNEYEKQTPEVKNRIICNYIAGMTDRFATKMHARLFGYGTGYMFEII